jgi:hypothetical protein
MQSQYVCPLCRSSIAADDTNVAADIALCRSCGKTSAFSVVSGSSEISLNSLKSTPRGIRIEKDFEGGITIIYHRLSSRLWSLIAFTALWSGLLMWDIYDKQFRKGQFDLDISLHELPFLLMTIVFLSIIAFRLFKKWRITLRNGTGSVFVGAGPLGWTRHFTYNRNSLVAMRTMAEAHDEPPRKSILIRTDDKDFVFGAMLKEDAKFFIAATLKKEIGEV